MNAINGELCGDKPAVAAASISPSKLQGTMNFADLMPSRAFLATSSAFILPDDPATIFVNSVLLLSSEIRQTTFSAFISKKKKSRSGGNISGIRSSRVASCYQSRDELKRSWPVHKQTLTLFQPRSLSVRREYQRDMNVVRDHLMLQRLTQSPKSKLTR